MGDDSLILREDGYIRMNFPVTSLTYHNNLNIILVKTDVGGVHVLDVNSGEILQSSRLSADEGGVVGVVYAPGADRVFVWDSSGVGARTDYNGVLLLHTALQCPLPSSLSEKEIKIELVLSEAVLLYQCLQSLDVNSIEGLAEFIKKLKIAIENEPCRKGVKAQKWSTVTISLPQSTFRLVTAGVVQDLKDQKRRIPALAIASAVGQRANDLVPYSRDEDSRASMYSEAERKQTFKRWPHMDYKWALPARMAQAGFYHQPSPSGDDRAMCFTCMVCLVCWEKSDEPWVEHERHSPNCPFVKGEYTHNVPITVTDATACATPCPNVTVVSRGNYYNFIATGTTGGTGKVNVWKFDCGLKLMKYIHLSPYDSIFSGLLSTDSNKVWSTSLEKDSSTYSLELTAMAFVGLVVPIELVQPPSKPEEPIKDSNVNSKPSLVCAVIITRSSSPTDQPIKEEDTNKALFDSGKSDKSKKTVQAMNDQNEAKNNQLSSNKMLFLLTYDINSSSAGSITTVVHTSNSSGNSKPGGSKKVCTLARADDGNIYDDIYFQYSDEETELPQCTNTLIDEQISNVINLNASSSKDDSKIWEPKKILFTKHFKVLPPPPPTALLPELPESGQGSMLDFVCKITQMKSWKSGNLDSVGTKLADQTDAVLHAVDPYAHYLNMNGPLQISDVKWYDGGEGTEKVKAITFGGSKMGTQAAISNSNNDGFDSDPPQEEAVSQGVAIQCLSLPDSLKLQDDSKVTHLIPTHGKQYLLVIVSSVDPEKVKNEEESDVDNDSKMDVDEVTDQNFDPIDKSDSKCYFILYKVNLMLSPFTLDDNPISIKELPFVESPIDVCMLPPDKNKELSFAAVGVDGALRVYSMPHLNLLSKKRNPKSHFTSVVYCASVERLSVSTRKGMIYFYALNNREKDPSGNADEDEFANIDFEMLQKPAQDETVGEPPVIIANKNELNMEDLETLIKLTGFYGENPMVPYSAVVPGFWCELSPAQRSRAGHRNNRTWRLQNTSSTWDEHVLEVTLPYSASIVHIEFGFTLHTACTTNLPVIHVTLLKQNLNGIGYKKDASFGPRSESPVEFSANDADNADMTSNIENVVNSEEYLQVHNAEILAGPVLLSSGLDLSQQSGVLILTSPLLYRTKAKTFLIHIKTLYDPAKDMNKGPIKTGESNSKKASFIGCDWLHQISMTVRTPPHTPNIPMDRQQRNAMLESNNFLNTLCDIATSKEDCEKRMLALDLILWVISIRLQRLRVCKNEKGKDKDATNPVEAQQLECVNIIEKHLDALLKTCILCGTRSMAKKTVKIILMTSEGAKQLLKPWKSTFETSLLLDLNSCIPLVGACSSAGALRWLTALAQQAAQAQPAALLERCLALLHHTAATLTKRADVYHNLLRARFGLYGLPLERSIFASDVPELGRSTSTPVTFASVLAGDNNIPVAPKPDYQLKDLLNLPPEIDGKSSSSQAWWAQNNSVNVFAAGLSESMPLHVSCHVASDGTKLESNGARHNPTVVSMAPGESNLIWTIITNGELKHATQDPDSLEDIESSLMECDPQEKLEFREEKLFKDRDQCGIPWASLVTRPPQHTLVVERMHSGARRYIVLDFGHIVRLTDVIIPSCSDLVTLSVDTWVRGEEYDSVKLAHVSDIATKHLVFTDIQPPPLCRYLKITTIGQYGMSAMKCKIPLGWFYGEIAEITNVQASINSLIALNQDLTCRFKLATGKLMDLLNPYLDLYNGNAAHMMAYLNLANDTDPKVIAAYQECIELQQQLHTCNNILKKLQKTPDSNDQVLELINKGQITSQELLEKASTDKLRVITENIVDMLLYFYFQCDVPPSPVSRAWCTSVSGLVWWWQCRGAAALGALLARLCGAAPWWGAHLADTLAAAFAHHDNAPRPLDRCLVMVMVMARASLQAHGAGEGGVAAALAERALQLLRAPRAQPALTVALLTALAAVLDAATCANGAPTSPTAHTARWDWVTGGRAGLGSSGEAGPSGARGECKLHRRKLHKRLLHQVHEYEVARRGLQSVLDEQRCRFGAKARLAMSKRGGRGGGAGTGTGRGGARLVPAPLAAQLAHALVQHMLQLDGSAPGDIMLLAAKVVGRLCAVSGTGGAGLLEAGAVLGLARLAVTMPPWPRHALTTLLQDLVEFENCSSPSSPGSHDWPAGTSAGAASGASDPAAAPVASIVGVPWVRSSESGSAGASLNPGKLISAKTLRKLRSGTVADVLADSFGLMKSAKVAKCKINSDPTSLSSNAIKLQEMDYHFSQLVESDDSEADEKIDQFIVESVKSEVKNKVNIDNSTCNISCCVDARLESGPAVGEIASRRALVASSGALAAAVRAPLRLAAAPTTPTPAAGSSSAPAPSPSTSTSTSTHRVNPPLAHTLYDVFRHLALDFQNQAECTYLENVVSLWLTLNGSAWGGAFPGALAVPGDAPRIRLASDTVTALLHSLCTLENVSLRCWVLSMQALAWISLLPLQTEGSPQTMGRVILECEHFVPAIVKFVTMDIATDGVVSSAEPYLSGTWSGSGAGAAGALHAAVTRVLSGRGAGGALAALRCVAGCARRALQHQATCSAHDLLHTLLTVAAPHLSALNTAQQAHMQHAMSLLDTMSQLCLWWVRESGSCVSSGGGGGGGGGGASGGSGGAEARPAGLAAVGGKRALLRHAALAHLCLYTRKLLTVHNHHIPHTSASPSSSTSTASEEAQTDESKAQLSDTTNVDDERKQQAAKTPCIADTVLQHPQIMYRFYRALSMCDNVNIQLLNTGMNSEQPSEQSSLKEEVFWLVAQIASVAANPALMVNSLMEFLRKEEVVKLSTALQQLMLRLLDKPEPLAAFIDAGGFELAIEKLCACHQGGPSNSQALVSSLMNYLKLPPQLMNMSTSSSNNKKNQTPVIETDNGLINVAPLCTITCGNPTAQAAEVLLGGGGGAGGACAARRMRAAAWSYHFFSVHDASLALTLTLPYAVQLHEVHLQPHLTSLATCPGAVAVEAGCNGTLAPLGPPQSTTGMTYIRLVVTRPVVCTTVQLRLYKPRDSVNMGLLQIRLLAAPPFNNNLASMGNTNNWSSVVWMCVRGCGGGGGAGGRLGAARCEAVCSGAAASALCGAVCAGRAPAATHALHALLGAAQRAAPHTRAALLEALLNMDEHAHHYAFQSVGSTGNGGGMDGVCLLARQLCRTCSEGCVPAYVRWLADAARTWFHDHPPPDAALMHTLASVLWSVKEEHLLNNVEQLITDELFGLVYSWVMDVPEDSLLKKALDAVLCSMCYIRPELFKLLLELMEIPMDQDESMEGLTDDTKVQGGGVCADARLAWRLQPRQLRSLAAAAMSPAATTALLHSRLPAAVVRAIAEFSETKLQAIKDQELQEDVQMADSDRHSTSQSGTLVGACVLVDWARLVCAERRLKDWLGGAGSGFWTPLLQLLCHPRPPESTWQEGAQYAQLEENTIKLFAELTVCHAPNQKLFASTLHHILENMEYSKAAGISGFTRALILRLVLSGERVRVSLRWAGGGEGALAGAGGAGLPPHPAAYAHALHTLPLHTTVRKLLREHRPLLPLIEEASKGCLSSGSVTSSSSLLRSASEPAMLTVAEAWELSLAAASASKDKRVKEVKNILSHKQQNTKKRQSSKTDASVLSVTDELIESTIRVQVEGLEGFIPPNTTLAQLSAAAPHVFGPHLTLILHLNINGGVQWEGASSEVGSSGLSASSTGAVLREFGACGGLALVAARLPRPRAVPATPPDPSARQQHDLDWVKVDDSYEEVVEAGLGSATSGGACGEEGGCGGVPAHALAALGLLLKLRGYADALLAEGARAVHLLRLLLGVTHDEDGRRIVVGGSAAGNNSSSSVSNVLGAGAGGSWSLGTLPFRVVARLLHAAPPGSSEGRALRLALLSLGAVRLVLSCLAVFSHHKPTSENGQGSNGNGGKAEEKSQLYWAKGTGFGTGSTQQSWNVEQALVRQRTEEEYVTVLLQVLASYMNPEEKWPPEEGSQESQLGDEDSESEAHEMPPEFIELIANSSLVPAISSYLRNDSVLDMSRHIPLYVCVLRCARALHRLRSARLAGSLRVLPRLLASMARTTNSYATKLRMSKKNIFGKMTYSQRYTTSSDSELSEEDEGLAALIADIQATSALVCVRAEGEAEGSGLRAPPPAARDARYIDIMRTMQFDTFEMIAECAESGFRFTVPYHFEGSVRAAGERAHPARMKRLAQEAATLATSLPLSYSSSVFVRTDTARLDVMKVLITGPSDTPYANGCFVLDVYFPADYPAVPMLINLETTGRHSVRFNPNLYNDGKVCLSVLNTWHGRPEEKWNAHTSSFLQVLVSIQSLILVPEPYFNEPGYERSRGSRAGSSASLEYNSNIYQACVRWAMLDHLRSPSPCFKEVIQTHFWMKRNEIIQTVASWISELEGQSGDERTQRSIHLNLMALKRHYVKLQEELAKLPTPPGMEDLDEPFQVPAAPSGEPAPSPPHPHPSPPPPPPPHTDEIDHDMEKLVSEFLD